MSPWRFRLFSLVSCVLLSIPTIVYGQQAATSKKVLRLSPQKAVAGAPLFHLLPPEEEQEAGNAVPVMLRMVYEQTAFMKDIYPKLGDYAEMDVNDPKFKEFYFARFAEQLVRAGSMSHADWQYPLRSERPYLILLPDLQSQRQLAGRGMTAWIRLLLSKGETDEALRCIKAQLACGRHCAATPIVVCHLVGLAIANMALDNLELAMQSEKCPNMYWSLATLPPTLHDLGPMVRWELWASPAEMDQPLPPIGDAKWTELATRFVELYGEVSEERYTPEEGLAVQNKMRDLAIQELPQVFGFSETDIMKMSKEELIMRWIYMQSNRMRTQLEPMAYQSPIEVIAVKNKLDAQIKELLAKTGAKTSPFPLAIAQGVLVCKNFERRVKFLQTIEALRDHASKHDGHFPQTLDELELPAPNDPFTEKPFLYEAMGDSATLRQAEIDGFKTTLLPYELSASK
jgi:hypothetical protein